jgi:DNA-binding IclR family transcriptional regulator
MSHGIEKYTERTMVTFTRMKEELIQIAAKGYAVNDEELLPGYFVLAAPVFDSRSTTVGAISITMPADQTHSGKEAAYAALLGEAARKTSLQLGYSSLSHRTRFKRSSPPLP